MTALTIPTAGQAAVDAAKRGAVRILHTSDWHAGKTVRGRPRDVEHGAVLAQIAGYAAAGDVDLVIVAGDLFDSAAPPARAEQTVYEGLLALTATQAAVAVTAGNHDHPDRLAAVAPLLDGAGVTLVARPAGADNGGVAVFETRSGVDAVVALCPFVPQRRIVNAQHLICGTAATNAGRYRDRMARIFETLAGRFREDTANVLTAHAFFAAAARDGAGERAAHFIDDYAVPAEALPAAAQYAALGHVHRAQKIPAACPAWYCGSPLALDFGEADPGKCVLMVDIDPAMPARVTRLPLTAGRGMRTVEGELDTLAALAENDETDDWLRVVVTGDAQAGLASRVRDMFGDRAVDVRASAARRPTPRRRIAAGGPRDLFEQYLRSAGAHDPAVLVLFDRLLDDDTQPDTDNTDNATGNTDNTPVGLFDERTLL